MLTGIIPFSLSAVRKRKAYPSKADDAGSPTREAKYLSTIILNKLNAAQEVSDQIAVLRFMVTILFVRAIHLPIFTLLIC